MYNVLFSFLALVFILSGCNSSGNETKENAMKLETKLDITPDKLAVKVGPICGMSMEQTPIADTMTYKGNLYGFCHPGCKEEFKANPEKALADLAKE